MRLFGRLRRMLTIVTTRGTSISTMATTIRTIRTTTNKCVLCVAESGMDEVITLQGLYQAYTDCRKRKRHTVNAQRYEMQLLDRLYHLLESLHSGVYVPSRSLCFMVEKPKAREIHAAHFTDRVLHHWLVPRLEALYEPIFIYDVYSNRKGKGIHQAVKRLQGYMQGVGSQGYFMQLDIANFFNTIDRKFLFKLLQQRLAKAVKKKIKNNEAVVLRDLCHHLLKNNATDNVFYRGSDKQFKKVPAHKRLANAPNNVGLPIGNLTSQFFANVYMNELDQFIKHQLKCRYYLRYVDDFILLSKTADELVVWQKQIITFLQSRLHLRLKEESQVKPVAVGADFLGYITKPYYRLVRRRVVHSFYERLCYFETLVLKTNKKGQKILVLHEVVIKKLQATLASYLGHFKHANAYRLLRALLAQFNWLRYLFIIDTERIIARWEPKAWQIVGYKSQIAFFKKHYPYAKLCCQRGTQTDIFLPEPLPKRMSCKIKENVTQLLIREQGYLKGGLKRRVVTRIYC